MPNDDAVFDLCKQLMTCPVRTVFRTRIPWAARQKANRYGFVISCVTGQTLSSNATMEFVAGTINKDGDGVVKGLSVDDLFSADSRRSTSNVALFPVYTTTKEDMKVAKRILDWYPPIRAIPFKQEHKVPQGKTSPHRMYARDMDWQQHGSTMQKWCAQNGWTCLTNRLMEFDQCETIELILNK